MGGMGENGRGALLMAAGMAAFTINDAFMKLLGGELPLFQVLLMRGSATTLAFLLIAWRMGLLRVRLGPGDGWRLAVRTAAEAGGAILFLTALFNMPLANATALLQLLPLTVTLAAMLFLREAVGWRRLAAILAGFAGVVLIVRPGTDGFDAWSILVVLAVLCITVRELATRRMSGHVPSIIVAMVGAAGVTAAGAAGATLVPWVAPSPQAWGWLGGATAFILAGYLLSVMAVRVGDMGFVAPFRYAGLLWALILGWVVFGDWPDVLTLLGAAVVVGAGLFTFAREQRAAQQIARKAGLRGPRT